MGAQTVKEITSTQAQALVAGGKVIAKNTYAVPSRGVTVTLKPGSGPGMVKAVITKGCAC